MIWLMLQASAGTADREDVPGVPASAWVRVQRGIPPSDPFSPGDGFVVAVDGARFLPACVTLSRVVGAVWSSSGNTLSDYFEGDAITQQASRTFVIGLCTSACFLGIEHLSNTRNAPTMRSTAGWCLFGTDVGFMIDCV